MYVKEENTWLREYMKFLFESRRNFISSCSFVVSSITYTVSRLLCEITKFQAIFRRFSKIFENSPRTIWKLYEHFRSFSENCKRCPKICEENMKIFRLQTDTFFLVWHLIRAITLTNAKIFISSLFTVKIKLVDTFTCVEI